MKKSRIKSSNLDEDQENEGGDSNKHISKEYRQTALAKRTAVG
jgi:hypothetical protein